MAAMVVVVGGGPVGGGHGWEMVGDDEMVVMVVRSMDGDGGCRWVWSMVGSKLQIIEQIIGIIIIGTCTSHYRSSWNTHRQQRYLVLDLDRLTTVSSSLVLGIL